MRGGSIGACPLRSHVDPRLLRFSAGATAVVLVVALLLVEVLRPLAVFLLVTQVAVFAFTAFVSFQWSVWAQLFALVVWPRLTTPAVPEDSRPPRFAQLIGFVLTAAGLVAFVLGADALGYALTAVVVGMTALNAVTGLCLGCRVFHLAGRSTTA